ncbi:MAG: 16S rRNA (cytosine(1402)-N(4))-methyltransferase RsmH [Candidatus Fimenecus sp.]
MEFKHVSVLLNESVTSLEIKPDGFYVDCTAGGGGHSQQILNMLSCGKLLMIDRDPDAIENLRHRFEDIPNAFIVNDNFFNIKDILKEEKVDGILCDLGVSSFQLDEAERGFSYLKNAPLDMRMSKRGISAKDVVNGYSKENLIRIFRDYGEEKNAIRIANEILKRREGKEITDTIELSEIISSCYPAKFKRDKNPSKKVFQAIRIEVNGELLGLSEAIEDMFSCLKIGGILSMITFHSIEDRIVKHKFQEFAKGCICPPDFPICVCGNTPHGEIKLKGITADIKELEKNTRARSARLRSIKKLKDY